MSLSMDQLGGFVRLGPQRYPERPNAVQIIERGPHGQRLAADPVRVRERGPRGSGFRFWVEEMNVPADVSWNPRQRVTGLLGLGAEGKITLTPREIDALFQQGLTAADLREAQAGGVTSSGHNLADLKSFAQDLLGDSPTGQFSEKRPELIRGMSRRDPRTGTLDHLPRELAAQARRMAKAPTNPLDPSNWVKYIVGGVLIVGGLYVVASFAKGLGSGIGGR